MRAGRFVYATGAIRPIHVDGLSALARTPWGATVEAFGGVPVAQQSGPRLAEWIAGGRLAQTAKGVTGGISYLVRRSGSERVTEEAGADFATTPANGFDLAGRAAYDLISRGVAEATASAASRFSWWRLELFASHRSPGRLLPSTSLFSVLGDIPSQVLGTSVRWNAAPRLDLLATAAGQSVARKIGGYGTLRITLRTDDHGEGSIGIELRRQDVSTARWSGVRLLATEPLGACLRASTELELAWSDDRDAPSVTWPWGLVSLGWRKGNGWEAALAVEAGGTPQYRFETHALVRLSRTFGAL